jgi:hypothetical protein
MTTPDHVLEDALADRQVAEELQDRLRREQQTAAAIRAYLISKREASS